MKKGLALWMFIALLLAAGGRAGAQQQTAAPFWYTLERGKSAFRAGAYGEALLFFEDARRARADWFETHRQNLILLLSRSDVRPLKDNLRQIEIFISLNKQDAAATALAELFFRVSREEVGDSAARALEELDRLKVYPEAEYWLGETYQAEGELALALTQYRKAYDQREFLENPGFTTEILYKIAEVHRLRQEYQEMEARLQEILAAGPGITGLNDFALASMTRALENEGVNRFLVLYRGDNFQAERAYRRLGLYYYASSRHTSAAEALMFAVLLQNSLIISEVTRSRAAFSFTTLDSLMEALARQPELLAYLDELEYFQTLYYLANALYATGKNLPAREIWTFLASRAETGEWRVRAQGQVRSPAIDRAVEMP